MSFLNQRFIITTLIYIILITLGIVFVLRPLIGRVQDKQATLTQEYTDYKNAQLKFTQLTKLNSQKESIQSAKDISIKAIPATLEQDRFLLTVEQLAKNINVTLASLAIGDSKTPVQATAKSTVNTTASKTATTPAATTATPASSDLAKINATIEITGQYGDVLKFIDSIEHLERIIAITSTTFTVDDTKAIKANLNVSAYGQTPAL